MYHAESDTYINNQVHNINNIVDDFDIEMCVKHIRKPVNSYLLYYTPHRTNKWLNLFSIKLNGLPSVTIEWFNTYSTHTTPIILYIGTLQILVKNIKNKLTFIINYKFKIYIIFFIQFMRYIRVILKTQFKLRKILYTLQNAKKIDTDFVIKMKLYIEYSYIVYRDTYRYLIREYDRVFTYIYVEFYDFFGKI